MKKELIDAVCRKFADEGKLIEAGFVALRMMAIPENAPEVQVREMRMAYLSGAQHLWASIMGVLEPGAEPTDKDMRRMDLINAELEAFVQEMKAKAQKGNLNDGGNRN